MVAASQSPLSGITVCGWSGRRSLCRQRVGGRSPHSASGAGAVLTQAVDVLLAQVLLATGATWAVEEVAQELRRRWRFRCRASQILRLAQR